MDSRVEDAVAFIETHLHEALTSAQLAARAELSPSQFTRLFRRETGSTPAAFLRARRMSRARDLIERTSLSIAEVMAQVGVSDGSHFARDFRRAHGFSPRTLRLHFRSTHAAGFTAPGSFG